MRNVGAIPRRRKGLKADARTDGCRLFFSNTWAIESARYLFSPRFGRSEQAA